MVSRGRNDLLPRSFLRIEQDISDIPVHGRKSMVYKRKTTAKKTGSDETSDVDTVKEDKMAESKLNLFEALREKTPEETEQDLRDKIRKESLEAGIASLTLIEKTRPDNFYGELFEKLDDQTRILLLLEYFSSNQPIIEKLFQLSYVTLEDVLTTYKKRLGEVEMPARVTHVSSKLSDVIDSILKKMG